MKRSISTAMIAGLIAAQANAAPNQQDTLRTIQDTIQQQQAEIDSLRTQLEQADGKIEATANAVEQSSMGQTSRTHIGGYGEHHLTLNSSDDKGAGKPDQIDAHRFVLFIGHRYNDRVKFFSELEVEHGFFSKDKGAGEIELEQAYIDWNFSGEQNLRLGQFLVPTGIINETHEPDTFYGVERNLVEKNIIPATWWETGIALYGEVAPGLSYDAAVHSGLNIDIEDEKYKIRDGRQKSAKAVAEDPAVTARIKYTAISGLELALAVQYQNDVTQGARSPSGTNMGEKEAAKALLKELHARYQIEELTLTALWAHWEIDGDTFEANNADEQEGLYLEASYKVMPQLGVFARHSRWDNQAGGGDTEMKQNDIGVNYWLAENVVIKADYSDQNHYTKNKQQDAVNLGIGWSF